MTIHKQGLAYFYEVEEFLQNPDLICKDEILNQQEPAIIFGDMGSYKIAAFENNPLYDENFLISAYKINEDAFKEFVETGNIGLSPEEKKVQTDMLQKLQAQQKQIREIIAGYLTMPR